MNKYYRRRPPRFLLSTNEAARPGAAFIVFTGKPSLVASVQSYYSQVEARDYVDQLPPESIYVMSYLPLDQDHGHSLTTTITTTAAAVAGDDPAPAGSGSTVPASAIVIELVYVMSPDEDLSRDKLKRIVEKMSIWYYRTQIEGLGSNDQED